MLTRTCQKTQKIDEYINIVQENLHIFWTTWGTLMKFSGKMWVNIKSQKNSSKGTLSKISEFSILGIEQNRKLRNVGSFLFFFLIHFINLRFCLSSFLSFLNLKLQQLSKFEVKDTFRDFRVFDFGYRVKSKTQKPRNFSIFLLKAYIGL